MPPIDNLMKRWGFVKLSSYGLVLTPEGRIISLRPAVLDDGMSGRIVGWQDDDLAAIELSKWEPARPAQPRAVATRVAATPPPFLHRPAPAHMEPIPVVVPAPVAPIVVHARVAHASEVDEDEWEWVIAIARARATADEVEVSRASAVAQQPRRTRQDTVPPPPRFIDARTEPMPPPKFVPAKTQPMAMVATPRDPMASGDWPKTEPLGNIDYEDYTNPMTEVALRAKVVAQIVNRPAAMAKATPAHAFPRAPSPVTVIPVPRLPRATSGHGMQPVVRTLPTPIPPGSPRRFPKGTGPVLDPSNTLAIAAPPPIRPAEDDRTKPGIALPPAAAAVALPRIPGLQRTAIKPRAARG